MILAYLFYGVAAALETTPVVSQATASGLQNARNSTTAASTGTPTTATGTWTFRTVDCSYPPGLFVAWSIRTITGRFVP